MEVAALLLAMQRHMGGIHIEHQLLRRLGVAGDELLHQHAVQRCSMFGRGSRLQATERGRTGQRLGAAHGRLHHQIAAQHVVVAHVRPAQTQTVDALRQQAAQVVLDTGHATLVAQRQSSRAGQTKTLIDPLEQQHAALTDDVTAIECGLDYTPSNPSKFDGPIGTLWHRQSSVSIGGEIPMKTRLGTRLPTYCS